MFICERSKPNFYSYAKEYLDYIMKRQEKSENEYDDLLNDEIKKYE